MATTVTEANYWTLTLATTTSPIYNFKFVVDMYLDGAKKLRIKQPRNAAGVAHFDYEKLLKNYITPTYKTANLPDTTSAYVTKDYDSIHLMPQNKTNPVATTIVDKAMSTNSGTLKEVTFKFYEEYSTTTDGIVSVSASSASDKVMVKINYAGSWIDQRTLLASKFDMSVNLPLSRFLSKLPYETIKPNNTSGLIPHLTAYDDYRTFSWLNEYNSYYNSKNGFIQIMYFTEPPIFDVPIYTTGTPAVQQYFASNPVGDVRIQNATDNGGKYPSTASTEDQYLIYCGVGAGNLKYVNFSEFGDYQLQEGNGIKYYTVCYINESGFTGSELSDLSKICQGMWVQVRTAGTTDFTLYGAPDNNLGTIFYSNADGSTMSGDGTFKIVYNEMVSERYLFEIAADENKNCTKYPGYTLAWKNKFGTWDYHYFDGASSQTESFQRSAKYTRNPGTWNGATLTFDEYERGAVENVEGKKQITLNTQFLDDAYNDYFQGLLMSNDVMIIDQHEPTGSNRADSDTDNDPLTWAVPVNLKDNSISYKSNVKDKLVQYSFTVEYAHALKTRF